MSKVLTPIIFIVIAIGLFFSYLRPAYDVLQAFQTQKDELDKTITESEDLLRMHNDILTKYENIDPTDHAKLKKILPDSIDVVRLIMDIDALSTKHNLTIDSFEVPQIRDIEQNARNRNTRRTAEEENNPVASAVLTIECVGEYQDFKAFLLDIEHSLSLLDVVGLEVKVPNILRVDVTDDRPEYKLDLQAYWLKLEQ